MSKSLNVLAAASTVIVLTLSVHAAEHYTPKFVPDSAQICVERFEETGMLNLSPVTINITEGSHLTLLGGQAGCVFVSAGNQSIRLTYPYPYGGAQNPRNWTTPGQIFAAEKGTITSFVLCAAADQDVNDPSWIATGWHDMWLLKRSNETPLQGCAVAAAL
jgi:hypothetical protein